MERKGDYAGADHDDDVIQVKFLQIVAQAKKYS